mmetsp:Transcript_28548/g.81093  ORF Transcript_28548/g.81093 Transcript_28548/m.81093 type:complete len:201 (-) Transcript_28548:516-1118(-)
MGKPMKPLISGMPDFWSRSNAQPPAPQKTNFERTWHVFAPKSFFCTVSNHLPLDSFLRAVTVWKRRRLPPNFMNALPKSFVKAPKSTSVPSSEKVSATLSFASRPSIINGHHFFISATSSEYFIPSKSGCLDKSPWRFFNQSIWSSPYAKVQCGVLSMKLCGSFNNPAVRKYAQYWRLSCQFSLTVMALLTSTVSPLLGV